MSTQDHTVRSGAIPAKAGIGLRHPHVQELLDRPPTIAWVEVHSENYLAAGGLRLASLERIRRDRPLSCHGVGLSLGSAEGLDDAHLAALRRLFDRVEPGLVSEHVSWSIAGGVYYNDLLPLPLTEEALAVFCRNVERAQDAFGRRILVENPSTYLDLAASRIPEPEFIAGHAAREIGGETVLIDDHGSRVIDPVWSLLDAALALTGPVPVLVEWDTDIPELSVLLAEAETADAAIARAAPKRRTPRSKRSPAHAA